MASVRMIETIEKHVAHELTTSEVGNWLKTDMKNYIFSSNAFFTPGMWLELGIYRNLRSLLKHVDLEYSDETKIDWYWQEIHHVLDLLYGNEAYKKTEYQIGIPLSDSRRKRDIWMLPYLEYAMQVITAIEFDTTAETKPLAKNTSFTPAPFSKRSCSEFIMCEIMNVIDSCLDTKEYLKNHPPDEFYSKEVQNVQINHLNKLINCFNGETNYSVSVIFEGLNKSAVTIVV
ncbi:hypothetical protein QUF63_13595 [Anaerolineales bacterium HSG25]|nr:hypothetical protein [Anaerolineales bacterium HSG25]